MEILKWLNLSSYWKERWSCSVGKVQGSTDKHQDKNVPNNSLLCLLGVCTLLRCDGCEQVNWGKEGNSCLAQCMHPCIRLLRERELTYTKNTSVRTVTDLISCPLTPKEGCSFVYNEAHFTKHGAQSEPEPLQSFTPTDLWEGKLRTTNTHCKEV